MESTAPIAVLEEAKASWPTNSARERGYVFEGYVLDKAGQPSFGYRFDDIKVVDTPIPVSQRDGKVGRIERRP
jgi:hypothetical protein